MLFASHRKTLLYLKSCDNAFNAWPNRILSRFTVLLFILIKTELLTYSLLVWRIDAFSKLRATNGGNFQTRRAFQLLSCKPTSIASVSSCGISSKLKLLLLKACAVLKLVPRHLCLFS